MRLCALFALCSIAPLSGCGDTTPDVDRSTQISSMMSAADHCHGHGNGHGYGHDEHGNGHGYGHENGCGATCADDGFEPNDDAGSASALTWDHYGSGSWYEEAFVRVTDSSLCSGNDDWYLVDGSVLSDPDAYLVVRLLARDAGLCRGWCDGIVLPPGAENTISVEVYDETGTTLLNSATDDAGVVILDTWVPNAAYAAPFLVRVYGPVEAEYTYDMLVAAQSFEGNGDECEC